MEAVWDDFVEAYDSGDWATVVSLTSSEGIAYFRQLQKSAATAGPEAIRELDTYQRTVIATLRGAGDHDRANAPTEELLTLLHGYRILGGGPGDIRELRIQRIQVLGDKAFTRIWQSPTSAWEIDFELEGGEWMVDLSDIAYIAGDAFETIAARRNIPLDRLMLAFASKVAGEPVTEAVWQKP